MGLKVSVTSVLRLLKEEGYSMDYRRQGWKSRRVDLVGHGAVSIKEFFNPGTKEHYFEVVYYNYIRNPSHRWQSKEFEDIRQAVAYINTHIEDAFHAFNDDLNTGDGITANRVARKYIRKVAGFFYYPESLPKIGSKLVGISIEAGSLDQGGSAVCVLAFDDSKEIRIFVEKEPPAEKNEKTAALVGTDSATIWAIAPENLGHLMAGGFGDLLYAWNEGKNSEEAERAWRQHGGAIYHTGADGIFDVKIPTPEGNLPIVNEEGYLPPYGTPEYRRKWFDDPPY